MKNYRLTTFNKKFKVLSLSLAIPLAIFFLGTSCSKEDEKVQQPKQTQIVKVDAAENQQVNVRVEEDIKSED